MHSAVQRIAAIHDLSGFGGGSLSAVVPILSALGIQVCALPTALLSTHTGGFSGFHFRDLTEDMRCIISHWKELGLYFDGIYSGFLGSAEQICLLTKLEASEAKKMTGPTRSSARPQRPDGVFALTKTSNGCKEPSGLSSRSERFRSVSI